MDDVKKVLFGAFGYLHYHRRALSRALCIPLVVLALLAIADTFSAEEERLNFVISLFAFVIQAIVAVITHRIILLGGDSVPKWGTLMPREREWRFILYTIGAGLLVLPVGLFALVPVIGLFLFIVAYSYILGRLSLVFPAIAIDEAYSLGRSWDETNGHGFLMPVTVGLLPILISLPLFLLALLPSLRIVFDILSVFVVVFIVAALSVAFKVVTEEGSTE